MKIKKFGCVALLVLSLAALLSGCGSSSKESAGSPADVAKVDEASCAQCHGSAYNSQSGMPIYSEYVQSKHFQNSIGEVVGCQDCHGGGAQHNGIGPIPYTNPDAAGKCFGCHKNSFLGLYNSNGKPTAVQKAHFYNITGAGVHDAMYVTKNFENGCTACHEPHNPLKGKGAEERKAWAESGHGRVSNLPFADEDFKGNPSCIRCHTSTGYSNFLANGWTTPFPSTSWATPGDNGREVLTCRTCHVNDSFAVKGAPAFKAPYNNNANPKQLPDIGESNLCVACHTGRENADSIEAISDFTNASFKNSHYKAGAALMYMTSGFWNFTSASTKITATTTYLNTMTPDNVSVPAYGIAGGVTSTHRKLGTPMINGDTHARPDGTKPWVTGYLDQNGPCVTCHLNASGVPARAAHGHSWKIDVNAVNQVCVNCHGSEVADIDVPKFPEGNDAKLEEFLSSQGKVFDDALGLIQNLLLTKYGIKYNPDAYPYFYDMTKDPSGNTAVKDWTRGTKNQIYGKRLMGVAFNLNLVTKDPGAYAHARTYVRRLVYDSIDWLDDNKMNFSVSKTAIAYDPKLYVKGATNAAPTTASMTYLIGYNRTTGTWNAPERP